MIIGEISPVAGHAALSSTRAGVAGFCLLTELKKLLTYAARPISLFLASKKRL